MKILPKIPAYVDISARSYIVNGEIVEKFTPKDIKTSSEHNLYLVVKGDSGRQHFVLALDKKAVDYFKKGIIKVKSVVKVIYNGQGDSNKYGTEEAYVYSPIFENDAQEIYSKGI